MKIGLNGSQDLFALLVRRKWLVMAPFIALSCAFTVLTYLLPRTFVSETLILIRPRDVPQDFVKDLIAGSPQQRLKAIEQTVLSRTNLVQILREFGDRLPEFERLNMDEKVLKLRSQIDILFEFEKSAASKDVPLTYFRISYQNQNPDLAQKIASKLTSLFIEQDNRARESQVFGTTEFLSSELEKVSDQLGQSEEKLRDVKTSRLFELPDQREANLRTLDRLGMDKKTNSEGLDRYIAMRLALEADIAQTPPTVSVTNPLVAPAGGSGPLPINPKVVEYLRSQQEFDELSGRYTAKHPDVLAAKARLDRAKKQVPADLLAALDPSSAKPDDDSASGVKADNVDKPAPPITTVPNPLYQRLVSQLQQVRTELEIKQKEKAWIEAEIGKYSQRVENTPKTEQDISEAVRVNEDLKKQYEDLKSKLSQARLSESLESKQKGSQFVIVDPANYPLVPAKPNKIVVFLASIGISLLISISFAVLVDIARQKIWTQAQVETFWGVPVLVDIPEILTDADVAAAKRKTYMYAASSVAAAVVWSVCLYGMYLKAGFILRQLDPLLQKVVYK